MSDFAAYEDELDAIRIKISKKIKDMTPEEHVEYYQAKGRELAKKYGLPRQNRGAMKADRKLRGVTK
jgi:hypothetical protein